MTRQAPLNDAQLLRAAEKILCDIDGCLISGDLALPGAGAFVAAYRDRLVLVTNNSTDTAHSLSQRLRTLGLEVAPERIVLAGEQAVQFIAQNFGPARVHVMGTADIQSYARDAGLTVTSDQAEVLLVCRDTGLSLKSLELVLRTMQRGVPVVLANEDITHPGPAGPAIETGALFDMLCRCVTPAIVHRIGKPSARLFEAALSGVAPENAVMIGDNPDTDIAGAAALGLPAIRLRDPEGFGTLGDLLTVAGC